MTMPKKLNKNVKKDINLNHLSFSLFMLKEL